MPTLSNIILHSVLIFKQRLWLPRDIAQLLSQCSYAMTMDAMFKDITCQCGVHWHAAHMLRWSMVGLGKRGTLEEAEEDEGWCEAVYEVLIQNTGREGCERVYVLTIVARKEWRTG